jgi:diguanylate cyclase (GGDEF)-like protein
MYFNDQLLKPWLSDPQARAQTVWVHYSALVVNCFYTLYHLIWGSLIISACSSIAVVTCIALVIGLKRDRRLGIYYQIFFASQLLALSATSYFYGIRGLVLVFPIVNGLYYVFNNKHAGIYSSLFIGCCVLAAIPNVETGMLMRFTLALVLGVIFSSVYTQIVDRQANDLHYVAHHDALTGIQNRRGIFTWLEFELKHAKKDAVDIALFYFDLDAFKKINDTYGHEVGDKVLTYFTHRLISSLREDEIIKDNRHKPANIGRLSGDEFVLILKGEFDENSVIQIGLRLLNSLDEPMKIGEERIDVTTSVGVSLATQADYDLDRLLDQADGAMYQAKQTGKNTVFIHK